MALVPYTITALAESDAVGTDGKNIVAGAVCSMYSQPSDTVVTLYDDAAGSNGSTSKVTGANGQVVVYVDPGSYRVSVNAVDSYTLVGAEKQTTLELINSTRTYQTGDTITTSGFTTAGDGGGAQWLATATTGQTPSQTPADRVSAELVDGSGRLWSGVYETTGDDFESFDGVRNQGFWSNAGGAVRRFDNRVFIDDAIPNTGDSPATQRTWLGQEANGFMTYYDTRSSQEVISSIGGIAVAAGSRSSDNDRAGERNTIGFASYTLNDASANTAWGIYGHSVLASEDSVATFVAELNIANTATTLTEVTPYSLGASGATSALRLRSGGETAESGIPCKPASAAMDIAHPQVSEATFDKGIVVQNGSISSSVGVDGNAIFAELPTNTRYQWKFGSSTSDLGGFMACSTTTTGSVAGLNFNNSGLDLCQSDGTGLVRFNPTSNAVFPTVTDTTSLGLTSREFKEVNSKLYKTNGGQVGVSGSFTTTDGKTITVTNGIVTSIV